MSKSFQNDLNFGLSNEEPIRQLLIKYFNEDIINTKDLCNDIYCKYDYEGTTTMSKYELKSRKNNKNKYPTTIIPVHKINSETINNGLYFIFNFTDKCSYIKYDKKLFKTFSTRLIKLNRFDKYDLPTTHYEIPINLLIDIN